MGLNPCSNGIWSLTFAVTRPQSDSCPSLNPCSNGIWSLTQFGVDRTFLRLCLNPCSNGIWSLTNKGVLQVRLYHVLILVLMEYGL